MKIVKFFLVFMFLSNIVFSQKITISGYVQDAETGEKLIGANVFEQTSKKGCTTNNYGFYSLTLLQNDTIALAISYIGYNRQLKKLYNKIVDQTINIGLTTQVLDEIKVTDTKIKNISERIEMSAIEIPIDQIRTLPAIGGESDIMKALQLMPGVQSGSEGNSGLYVRGGSPDQNLILLDDVPLYYINHLGGFVSVFNTDALNNVKLLKGGFPAQYGSRLSSVVDIRMKEGNMKKFETNATIGLVASKISVEGPIKKDTTSFVISARRFLLDLFTRPLTKIGFDGTSLGYTFYDINAKINHRLSDKDQLFLSFYMGDDRIVTKRKEKSGGQTTEKAKDILKWGNMLGAFRWNRIYNSKLFSNVTLAYTRYRYGSEYSSEFKDEDGTEEIYSSLSSKINDVSAKIDFEYYANTSFKTKFGYKAIYHKFTPGITQFRLTELDSPDYDTTITDKQYEVFESAIYSENHINIGDKLSANIGLRFSNYSIDKKTFYSLEPRILLNLRITDNFSFKSSYASMKQYVHLLSFSGIGVPTSLWMPTTANVPPETSYQFAGGFAQSLKNGTYELSVEGYYKSFDNLISFKEGSSLSGNLQGWEDKIETDGKGESYGAEFLLQRKEGALTGWIGYTISKTDRTFTNINNGKTYPYRYDRKHDISIVLNYRINEKINVSATWVYGTGQAITLPMTYVSSVENDYYFLTDEISTNYNHTTKIYYEKNSFRMRAYHKLDIGANFTKKKKRGVRIWNLSIFNVYNRQNPYYYYVGGAYETDENGKETYRTGIYQQSLFPIIPSVSYSFKF